VKGILIETYKYEDLLSKEDHVTRVDYIQ
jgi:hypothetical protein